MMLSDAEERALKMDLRAQERGDRPAAAEVFTTAPGYVQVPAGMHPDHDDAVVFAPGQLLPDWAADALRQQKTLPDRQGVYRLNPPAAAAEEKAKRR